MRAVAPSERRIHSVFQGVCVALFLTVLLAVGCTTRHDGLAGKPKDRPECAHAYEELPLFDGTGRAPATFVVPASGLAAAEMITDVPEFHDCQRFIKADGSGYDRTFAIFASRNVSQILRWTMWKRIAWTSSNSAVATVDANGVVTPHATGTVDIRAMTLGDTNARADLRVTVGTGLVSGTVTHPFIEGSNQTAAIGLRQTLKLVPNMVPAPRTPVLPVALIFSFGPGYPHLNIGGNFNCLYVYPKGDGFAAKVRPVGGVSDAACKETFDPDELSVTELTVIRRQRGTIGDHAQAARWEFDPVARRYFIGLACGDAWCDIGLGVGGQPFNPPAGYTAPAGTPEPDARVLSSKGWYDEQRLAVVRGTTTTPSTLIGTFVPHPDLADRKLNDYRSRKEVDGRTRVTAR
jgi:hypothetical protein